MPEGPEILFFSIYLKNKFLNYTISDIKSNSINTKINIPLDFVGKIVDISSKGKLLFFKITSNILNKYYYMHIHMGLSGWLLFKNPNDFVKYEFILSDEKNKYTIYLEDKSRLSSLEIYDEDEHNTKLNKMGIDIFSDCFTLEKFSTEIKNKKVILASFLLKQEIFCGIGNYIKNECLYMSNIKIDIKTNELENEQIKNLYNSILHVAYSCLIEKLQESKIEKLLPPKYNKLIPKNIQVPYTYKIYNRTITDDGKKVNKIKIGGRDTYTTDNI